MLSGRRIVLGISGGVAAYKAAYLARRLVEAGADVRCVMTPSATEFIGAQTLAAVTGEFPVLSFWDEPDDFRPERFASGYQARATPFTYLPFGGGPRNCIGGAFAQLEARIVLARLLQRQDLTLLQKKVKPNMGATLEPRPNVLMRTARTV